MHSIQFIREHADQIKKDLERRKDTEKSSWVDEVLALDTSYRSQLAEVQKLRARRNELSQEINKVKKAGGDVSSIVAEAKSIPEQVANLEKETDSLSRQIKDKQMRIPNILHESVPYGEGEEGNVVLKEWGEKRSFDFDIANHGELLEKKGQADFKRSAKISGSGFYFLKDKLVLLDMALQKYALDVLGKHGYTPIYPPFMMRREPYEGVTDLADFENVMYKIDGEDQYLIATSEHAIGGMYMNETFESGELPIKLAGLSTCFRKEIGSHGIDTRGLFRVHQFNKIEQFVFCKPEDSWVIHEEMLGVAEEIFQSLGLPYRVVNICTGDIGIVAAKKYDIEVWMPREETYREVVSCSNCTAYQATRLGIKYLSGSAKEFVHTLNSTAIATSRALRAIAENYQEKDGTIRIPSVLQEYVGAKEI